MQRCLDEFTVTGIKTSIPFHKEVMINPDFKKGTFCTDFIEVSMKSAPAGA